jgi:uncharacterized membrane protein
MTLPHLHLLLNHVPTVGNVIALGLLLVSIARKDDGLWRVGLEVSFVIGLLTLPVYVTGIATRGALEPFGVPDLLIGRHHDAALLASLSMLATAALAWLGLWRFRRAGRWSRVNSSAVLAVSLLTLALMTRAATMGGEIRHPEILADQEAAAADLQADPEASGLTAALVAQFVADHTWLWPANEALHFIGLWLLFGVLLLVNLRLLGLLKGASFASLHRLLPWAVMGIGVNVLTGMSWVIAMPDYYVGNPSFHWKIGLLLLAGAHLLYLTVFDQPWKVGAGDDPPATARILAAASIVVWVCVMYFGRMLPFLGNAF